MLFLFEPALAGPHGLRSRTMLEYAESRFINAALEMNLPLRNKQLPTGGRLRDSEKEKAILTEAVAFFHALTKTEWQHPDKFLHCVYRKAA
jgi:hypothetical protein